MVRTIPIATVLLYSVIGHVSATAQASNIGQKLQLQLQEANNIFTRIVADLRPTLDKLRKGRKLTQGKNLVIESKP